MVTAITQAKDLNTLALEDLIGSLKVHETLLNDCSQSISRQPRNFTHIKWRNQRNRRRRKKSWRNRRRASIHHKENSYFQATEKIKILSKFFFQETSKVTENEMLKFEVKELRNDLNHFIKSTETFQKIMGSQERMFDKAGLGFDISKNQKMYENFFIPEKNKIKCSL